MIINFITPQLVVKLIGLWPPYLASRISVESVNSDMTEIVVQMKQSFFNTNYVGTHFGGSLYSMCDPFYMFILLHHLKKDHIVWDQDAKIEFLKPGKGTVKAQFKVTKEIIEEIKSQTLNTFSIKRSFECNVVDAEGNIVAKVQKGLYIRRKDAKTRFQKEDLKLPN